MPKYQPKSIGREFVRRYYTILNKSPENLYCFYDDNAIFVHDDVNPNSSKTISVVGKQAICEVMKVRKSQYRHRCTIIDGIDTIETINDGLVVKVYGEIAYDEDEMRPFSQTFILVAVSPVKYYVYNEIFRYRDVPPNEQNTMMTPAPAPAVSEAAAEPTKTSTEDISTVDESYAGSFASSFSMSSEDLTKLNVEQMNEIQTKHLKSILQDSNRCVATTTTTATATKNVNSTSIIKTTSQTNQISEQTNKLFQDKCIITIGNVVNPNIDFNDVESESNETISTAGSTFISNSDSTSTASETVEIEAEERAQANAQAANGETQIEMNEEVEEVEEAQPKTDPSSVGKLSRNQMAKEPSVTAERKSTYAESLKLVSQEKNGFVLNSKTSLNKANDLPMKITNYGNNGNNGKNKNGYDISPPKHDSSSSSDTDILQVFIGNIPRKAIDVELRNIFIKFGRITRLRIHSNALKANRPNYAFVTYENINAVQKCLENRNSIYYPENGENAQKLNVNGDESIMEKIKCLENPNENQNLSIVKRKHELKRFQKNFVLCTNDEERKEPNEQQQQHQQQNQKHHGRTQRRRNSSKV